MLSVDEYRQAHSNYKWQCARLQVFTLGCYLLVIVVLDIGFWVLLPTLRVTLTPEQIRDCALAIMGLPMLVFALGPFLITRREKTTFFLHCPRCRKFLMSKDLIIATRRCPHCGGQALTEEPPLESTEELPSWEEWLARRNTSKRGRFVSSLPSYLAVAVLTLPFVGLMFWLQGNPGRFSQWVILIGGQLVIVIALAPFVVPGLLSLPERSSEKDSSNACPHCHERLRDEVTRLTGNCGSCGTRVVSLRDVPSTGDQRRYSVTELADLFNCVTRLVMEAAVVLLFALGVLALIVGMFFPPEFPKDKNKPFTLRDVGVILSVISTILLAIFWVAPRYRRLDSSCPSCNHKLRDLVGKQHLIFASKRCPQCRHVLVD
jgi:ssDNA-binding Zn-finger/Zn-ribbon topoisomerase 1